MTNIKTVIVAGALALTSTMAFAQTGAPTRGADLSYGYQERDAAGSFAYAPVQSRTQNNRGWTYEGRSADTTPYAAREQVLTPRGR
jgi:hypothetical protein